MEIEDIQAVIKSLPPEQYARLRDWFTERDWELWDRQIEADAAAAKLDFLIDEALTEKVQGKLREL